MLVTYSQAVSLKKLGFKEPCLYSYSSDGELCQNQSVGKVSECASVSDLLYDFSDTPSFSAPFLAQVQRWLLEKYGQYVYVEPSTSAHNQFYWSITKRNDTREDLSWSILNYNTPDLALSAGITECLRLLEE